MAVVVDRSFCYNSCSPIGSLLLVASKTKRIELIENAIKQDSPFNC